MVGRSANNGGGRGGGRLVDFAASKQVAVCPSKRYIIPLSCGALSGVKGLTLSFCRLTSVRGDYVVPSLVLAPWTEELRQTSSRGHEWSVVAHGRRIFGCRRHERRRSAGSGALQSRDEGMVLLGSLNVWTISQRRSGHGNMQASLRYTHCTILYFFVFSVLLCCCIWKY